MLLGFKQNGTQRAAAELSDQREQYRDLHYKWEGKLVN